MSDPTTTRVTPSPELSSDPSATVASPRSSDSGSEGTQAQTEPPKQLFQPPGMPVVPGFVVTRELARGGMGVVFAAHDPTFDREVAVKVMHSGQDGDRFVIESKITAQLPHPGIPPVYTLGTLPDGRPFLAMKLIAGHTLAEEVRSAKQANLPRLLGIFEQICQTVGFAHNKAIMHRDLKPANIMVGAFGEVLVMDWGLAKEVRNGERGEATEGRTEPPALDAIFTDRRAANEASTPVDEPTSVPHGNNPAGRNLAETVAGQVKGTPAYMAPEQARGERVDVQADVFALGGILSVLLTGKPPFQGDTILNTVIKAALADMAECFAKLDVCGADPELIAIAKKCLAAQPTDRYANGAELAVAVSAYRASVEQRLRQAERDRAVSEAEVREQRKRRRVQLALATVVGLALAAGGGFAWYSDRQETARKQKEELDEANRTVQHEREEAAQKLALERVEANRKQIERDRDQKVKEARKGIAADLKLEPILRKQYKFAEAAATLRQASDLTQSAPELLDAVQQALDNLAFVEKLDDIRFRKWISIPGQGRKSPFNTAIASPEYRAAFRGYGLDLPALDPTEAVNRIAASAIKAELVAAVDDWALYEPDEALRNRLLEIARKADPGTWANRLRDPAIWKNKAAITKLAADADPATTSPADLSVLAELMTRNGLEPAALLLAARTRYPNDFELAFTLGKWIDTSKGAQQIGALEAARALRPESTAAWFNLAAALKFAGDLDGAIAAYKELVRLDPKLAAGHYSLGATLLAKGDLDGAIAACKEAIKLDPKLAFAHNNLGAALLAKGDLDGAIAAFKEAIKLKEAVKGLEKKEIAENYTNLGNVLRDKKDVDGAIAAYRKAIELNPKYVAAHNNLGLVLYAKNDLAGAIAEYREAISHFNDEREPGHGDFEFVLAYRNLGDALLDAGQLDGSIAAYKAAIKLDPKFAGAHNGLGIALRNKGDVDGSIAACKEAIRLEPKSSRPHNNLGLALVDKGDLDVAIAEYKLSIKLDPKYAQPHFNMGVALAAKRDLKGAIAAYEEAINRDSSYAMAYNNKGVALFDMGDVNGAIAAYREAIKINPKYVEVHSNLGNALAAKGDLAGALAACKEAVKLDPKLSVAHFNLGIVYEAKGDLDEAVAAYKQAIKVDPKLPHPRLNLGNVLVVKGDLKGAIASYKEVIKIAPQLPHPYTALGALALGEKKYPEAIDYARTAIKVDPKYAQAHLLLGVALQQSGDIAGARAALTAAAKLDKRFEAFLKELPPPDAAPPPRKGKE